MLRAISDHDTELRDQLKSALWYHIGQTVEEATLNLGVNASSQFIGSLTEIVWTQVGNVATDLETFAGHAGRNRIRTEDVILLARRNEELEAILKDSKANLQKQNKLKSSTNNR